MKIDQKVFKQLAKFPKIDTKRILETISDTDFNPYVGDVQKTKGRENIWRKRAGSYRIFYEIYSKEKIVHIFWVERRTTQTY